MKALLVTIWVITSLPFIVLGFSNTAWSGGTLPFNLGAFGAPSCNLLSSTEATLFVPNVGGGATLTTPVPNNPALPGFQFFAQCIGVDPSAGGFGVADLLGRFLSA